MIAALLATVVAATAVVSCKPADSARTDAYRLLIERLARLDNPWGMAFLPDGRLLITEKPGRLRIYAGGKLSEPLTGVPPVAYGGQGGLLDVEIDPDFGSNRLVYLAFAEPKDPLPPGPLDIRSQALIGGAVGRGRLEGSALRDFTVIWRQVPKVVGLGHYGGRLAFAPDGTLFITSGERQKKAPAQARDGNLGKIARLNRDGSIPGDNRALTRLAGLPEVWSIGHRNPLGAAINPWSKELWTHEMGPRGGDEINVIEPGRNYGWPLVSDGDDYDGSPIPDHATRPDLAAPVRSWNPSISPSGMLFYSGDVFPRWKGNVILGGLSSNALIRLILDGRRVVGEERIDMDRRVRDIIQAPDGSILLLSDGNDGELLRLTPNED